MIRKGVSIPTFTVKITSTASANGSPRYILAAIDQTIARVTLRMTYMVTPNLSLQYYGQPFGTAGVYSRYKIVTDASGPSYAERFAHIPSYRISADARAYEVDEDDDGMTDYGFQSPDFNFGQFRSNMVLRWEYIPGSTFFFVWTRERNGAFYDHRGTERYQFDFPEKGHNIFLAKFTYRFVL